MGYTGIAYLNGRPTDQLIAEAISGYADLSGTMSAFWFPSNLHYREIRNRMENTLSNAYAKLSEVDKDAHNLTVLASGLQRKDNGIKRVMFRIDITKTGTTCAELAPRFMPWNTMQITAAGTVHYPTMNKMGDRLKAYIDTEDGDPKVFREIMMDAVRETGEIVPTKVGRDAVGVYLDVLKPNPKISAHFHPKNYDRLRELLQRTDLDPKYKDMSTVPTPFVLMPGTIWGPSIGPPGGWDVMTDSGLPSIAYEYTGFNIDESGPGSTFFTAQPRRLWP